MPTTRKKVIKTVYKNEDDSDAENSVGDFSDSGSEAEIPDAASSDDEEEEDVSGASAEEFHESSKKKLPKPRVYKKKKFAKEFISKISRQSSAGSAEPNIDALPPISVRDLTEEDKLLPSVLNLSESDSSDDETPKAHVKKPEPDNSLPFRYDQGSDAENETHMEYKDVWSHNIKDTSEEVAKKTFMELEQHKSKIEETKASLLNYKASTQSKEVVSDVKDLLALGEEVSPKPQLPVVKKGKKGKKAKDDSDSEMEDWEEVKDAKTIPQQGLQLIVDLPDAAMRKSKKVDIEMMMKRKMNRVKKEYQIYMHKVHVLCWLGHGNYVSRVLNDQEVLAAALSLVPSKDSYPGERVDIKYLEQITTWFKDKLTLKQDKNEEKFKPKAPSLKEILIASTKARIVTAKKYLVFIFVSLLRALGLQCRIIFNFTTLPIKPPSSELCSLSTKPKDEKASEKGKESKSKTSKNSKSQNKSNEKISQMDGNDDRFSSDDGSDFSNIMQLDGNDDAMTAKPRSTRSTRTNKIPHSPANDEDVSPPKRARKSPGPQNQKPKKKDNIGDGVITEPEKRTRATRKNLTTQKISESQITKDIQKTPLKKSTRQVQNKDKNIVEKMEVDVSETTKNQKVSPQKLKTTKSTPRNQSLRSNKKDSIEDKNTVLPKIVVTQAEKEAYVPSKYFENEEPATNKRLSLTRNRSQTAGVSISQKAVSDKDSKAKCRTKSAPGVSVETSKYFEEKINDTKKGRNAKQMKAQEDRKRVSHRDLLAKNKPKVNNDVTGDLVDIIKKRVKEAKDESKKGKVKAKVKESDEDSDYLPEEPKHPKAESDEDFKPCKISPKPSTSKKIDRRVLSSDKEELPKNKTDVWCEVYVEELEQWIAVDVIRAKVHCTNEIYNRATHPVCYVVGWDNNNYLKDVTRRYVPHWNTVTRKQRADAAWWNTAVKPWLAPDTARGREEDEQLDRLQLEAPLPKSIAEYKNHPLYALKRHLLKFEAIYPPDAATLGFIRNEPVYARECVYVCRSRDTWLKEARVVKLGEEPYKTVKARPKWDKLSNRIITDVGPLHLFGIWQTKEYEPPTAENGVVPRNAYGNVELFKECMLPKGTAHVKLPGLNRIAKKLNIDCAPAMTGFDFNGGWSHPVYDGFVVCEEFEKIITEAWVQDQEEQERKEREKIETRVYGNWKRLIKGLFIRERLKHKYGFEEPAAAQPDKKKKGPKLVVKKK